MVGAFLFTIAAIAPAAGEADTFLSGNDLHWHCSRYAVAQRGISKGCGLGVADALAGQKLAPWQACFLRTATSRQVTDVVKRRLDLHPEKRHFNAKGMVARSRHGPSIDSGYSAAKAPSIELKVR